MSRSGKVSRSFEFLRVSGAAPAEKNKEKVEANCTGFSAEFIGSQSVEMSESESHYIFFTLSQIFWPHCANGQSTRLLEVS